MIRRGPRPVAERLRRLLIILPWITERGEASVAEMTELFDVTESELIRDLELAAVCGLPPFVDEMIDVYIDEGVVYAGVPRIFDRPFRLTAPEGFALLAGARAALTLPGADPESALSRAVGKLEAALGRGGLVVDQHAPPHTDALVNAAQRSEQVVIRHWGANADQATERTITPRVVFQDRGFWYVQADDHLRSDERVFRIDRIESLTPTGVISPRRPVAVPDSPQWFADSDLPLAVLRVSPEAERLLDQYPIESRHELDDGRIELRLRITSPAWLAGVLIWLGDRAELAEPAEWIELATTTATVMLRRYTSV